MQKLHDLGYGLLFSNKEIFRQLLTSFVKQKWVKELDFSKCELIKDSFVSKMYKKTFSDLLYKVKLHGRDIYIVILLEFKSQPERFTVVQMAGYLLDFYRHLITSEKKLHALPPVFPVLLYSGKRRWTMPVHLDALVEGAELLGKYKIDFECFPIRVNSFGRKTLLEISNVVSTLFLAEAHYDFELLEREFLKHVGNKTEAKAWSLLLNWFRRLYDHERISEGEYRALERIYHNKEEVAMLLESIRREKAQLRNAGKREGKKEGRQEGKQEGRQEGITLQKIEIARMMLSNGEPLGKIKLYTGLSKEAILKLDQPRNGKKAQS